MKIDALNVLIIPRYAKPSHLICHVLGDIPTVMDGFFLTDHSNRSVKSNGASHRYYCQYSVVSLVLSCIVPHVRNDVMTIAETRWCVDQPIINFLR